jgi:hypothetical protein
MSRLALLKTSPVKPPSVKHIRKLITITISTPMMWLLSKELSQVKILTAVGTAITIVADAKYNLESSVIPATYMW